MDLFWKINALDNDDDAYDAHDYDGSGSAATAATANNNDETVRVQTG